jgi:hypothetical protein
MHQNLIGAVAQFVWSFIAEENSQCNCMWENIMSIFLDWWGLYMWTYLNVKLTVNAKYYLIQYSAVHHHHPATYVITRPLSQLEWEFLNHPLYSTAVTPSNYDLMNHIGSHKF